MTPLHLCRLGPSVGSYTLPRTFHPSRVPSVNSLFRNLHCCVYLFCLSLSLSRPPFMRKLSTPNSKFQDNLCAGFYPTLLQREHQNSPQRHLSSRLSVAFPLRFLPLKSLGQNSPLDLLHETTSIVPGGTGTLVLDQTKGSTKADASTVLASPPPPFIISHTTWTRGAPGYRHHEYA